MIFYSLGARALDKEHFYAPNGHIVGPVHLCVCGTNYYWQLKEIQGRGIGGLPNTETF